jgi:hypothetical protein
MKKYIFYTISLSVTVIAFFSCSDMNDMHDKYLRDGEKTYVGRVDSVRVFSGNERVLIRYWITDPRVKKLHILWNQKRDSTVVSVPEHEPLDALEVMIGEGNGNITEGDHTFFFYSHDDRGHRSVVFESLINVYGERYQATLINRSLKGVTKSGDNKLTLTWGGSSSANEIGIEILFKHISGEEKSEFIPIEDIRTTTVIEEVDFDGSIQYRTWFKPNPDAIDRFGAPLVMIQL